MMVVVALRARPAAAAAVFDLFGIFLKARLTNSFALLLPLLGHRPVTQGHREAVLGAERRLVPLPEQILLPFEGVAIQALRLLQSTIFAEHDGQPQHEFRRLYLGHLSFVPRRYVLRERQPRPESEAQATGTVVASFALDGSQLALAFVRIRLSRL